MQPGVFRAFHLTERLKLNSIARVFPEEPFRSSGTELAYQLDKSQYLFIHNFGSVVFYNVEPGQQERIVGRLQQSVPATETLPTREEFRLESGDALSVDFDKVVLPKITFEAVSLVSLVLAKSAALDYFENAVDRVLEKWGDISDTLNKKGLIKYKTRDFVRFVGFCIATKQKIIGSASILDVPEPTWDDPGLEKLYLQMSDQFELRDRYRTLETKLQFIQDALMVLSNFSHSQRAMRLEWAIVLLIALEVILIVWEFVGKLHFWP